MSPLTLLILDVGLYALHIVITAFNVFGWISERTRRIHRWCVGITAACWLAVGPLLYGTVGYCPLTDWHWRVKQMRGEMDLPGSFISYLLHQIGFYPAPQSVDMAVGGTFAAVILITIILWWREKRQN